MHFDPTISLGNVLTVLAVIGAGWRLVIKMDKRISSLEQTREDWREFLIPALKKAIKIDLET